MKLKRRDIFRMLDRDCVNTQTVDTVKEYINRLIDNQSNNQAKKGGK